jgi:glutathione synthase
MIERSMAIKAPSIGYQLAGSKKIQQILTIPGQLEYFIDNKEMCDQMRAVFVEQFYIDVRYEITFGNLFFLFINN